MLKLCYCALAALVGAIIGATAPDSWRGEVTAARFDGPSTDAPVLVPPPRMRE
jgi:hypothetical protein